MTLNGATAIWSGYNHQGRVGLFVALREINRIVGTEKLDEWKLIFELGEDFQVLRQSGTGLGEVISRHQVKAYNSTAPSRYEEVFTKYHKKDTKGALLYKDGNPVMKEGFNIEGVPEGGRYVHVIKPIDISLWRNDYGIQLYEYPAVDGIGSPIPYCNFSVASNDEDELMILAMKEIVLVKAVNNSEAALIWKGLQHSLQSKISVAHQYRTHAEFTFDEIKKCIDNPTGIIAYESDNRRRSVLAYGDEFVGQREESPTFTDENKERVAAYIQDLTALSNDSILESLRYLHIKDKVLMDVNSNGMKDVVYETLSKIVDHKYEKNCVQFEKNGSSYILTVITEMERDSKDREGSNSYLASMVADSLIKEDAALMFRKAKIINKSLDSNFNDVLGDEKIAIYLSGREIFNITEPAPLEFISVDRAIFELNSEAV